MPLTYVRERPATLLRQDDIAPGVQVLIYDGVLERGLRYLGDRYRRLDGALRNADHVFLRGGEPSFVEIVNSDNTLRDLTAGIDVTIIAPNAEGTLAFETPNWATSLSTFPITLDEVRAAEIETILRRCHAILAPGADHHFVLPSGTHAPEFIRLGDALRTGVEVSRICDWIVPHIHEDSVVVADTGSILPVLLELERRFSQRYNRKLYTDVLDEYPTSSHTLAGTVNGLRGEAYAQANVVLLVSVNSSGRLLRRFRGFAEPGDAIVVICDTAEDPASDAPALYRRPIPRWEPAIDGNCVECPSRRRIYIDPQTYELLPSEDVEIVTITPARASKHVDFWQTVLRTEALRLHVETTHQEGEAVRVRHMPVDLDIPSLLGDPDFREGCIQALREVEPDADCILLPDHDSALALVDLVSDAYPRAPTQAVPVLRVAPGALSKPAIDTLESATRIVVLDDALITGRTLMNVRRAIYYGLERRATGMNRRISGFTVVARPPSSDVLRAVSRPYRDQSGVRVKHGISIHLPGPSLDGGRNCPWCDERALLQHYLPKLTGRALDGGNERLRQLNERPLLVPLLTDSVPNPADRTVGSFYGDLDPITAFVAAMAATFELCQELEEDESRRPRRVVNLAAMIDAYFDSVFLAAFIRLVPPKYLRWSSQERAVLAAIARLDPARVYPGTVQEIAWGAVCGKVPASGARSLLADIDTTIPINAMLADIVGMVEISAPK